MSMQKFIVRLKNEQTTGLKEQLFQEGMQVVFHDHILKDLLIVQTEKTLEEIQKHPLFRTAEYTRTGHLDV